MNLQDPTVQIQREFLFSPHPFDTQYLVFVQGSHFICLHFCGDLDHGYSAVCEEVGILVRRCKSFSMIKTNLSRKPAC